MIKIAHRLKTHRLLLAKHWYKEVWERKKMEEEEMTVSRFFFYFIPLT